MATAAEAHIEAQARLRALAVQGVSTAWDRLASYDAPDVARFLAIVVPLVLAAQRRSASLTSAFIARSLRSSPIGFDIDMLIGAAVRNGTTPDVIYRRPFVTTWTALKDHTPYEQAVAAGREQATGSAAMDVQNTMRHTLQAVGEAERRILGYRRVPDGDACPLCVLASGRRYRTGVLMEIHNRCGCGVDVITSANRGDFFGKTDNDLAVAPESGVMRIVKQGASREEPTVAAVLHGELGPLLVNAAHKFTGPDDLAA
jgi:hypothetical protein